MTEGAISQLVILTTAGGQAGELTRVLIRDGFYVTQIASSGGMIEETAVSLLIGLDRVRLPRLLEHIRARCRTQTRYIPAHLEVAPAEIQPLAIETQVGGAIVYGLEVERFEQI